MGHADRWRSAALIGAAAGLVASPAVGGALFVVVLARSVRVREGFGWGLAAATAGVLVLITVASAPTPAGLLLAIGLAAFAPLASWWSSVARPGDAEAIAVGFVVGAAAHVATAIASAQGVPISGLAAHQNVLGAAVALAVPSVAAYAIEAGTGRSWRWLAVVGSLGVVAATGSRGALIAALVGASWVLCHSVRRARDSAPVPSGRRWAALAALVALAGVSALWIGVRQPSSDGLTGLTGRATLWGIAAELVAERPVLGHGPGAWARHVERIEPSVSAGRFPHAHSGYLEVAISFGLVGLAVVVAYFASIFGALGPPPALAWAAAARATWVAFAIVNVGDAFVVDARFLAIVVLVSGAAWARRARQVSPPAPTPPRPTA